MFPEEGEGSCGMFECVLNEFHERVYLRVEDKVYVADAGSTSY